MMADKYWLVDCECCGGTGRSPASFQGYRVAYELQDEGPRLMVQNFTLTEAIDLVKKSKDPSCNYYIIAPNGRVLNETLGV
jgi:hypothetical protein